MLALLATAAFADPHSVEVTWSPTLRVRQDDLFAPLVHTGLGVAGGTFGYRWDGPRNALATGFEFGHVPGKSGPTWEYPTSEGPAHTWPSSWVTLRIPTGWGRDLVPADDLDVVVGGLFDVRIEVLSWSYGVTWTSGYSGAFTLGPWVDITWRSGRWTVEGSLTLPLGGWVTRSPYALNDDEFILANKTHNPFVVFGAYFADGHGVWIGNYQAARARVGGSYALNDTVSLVAAGRFEVLHDPNPLPVVQTAYALDLGVRIAFGGAR